MDGDTFVWVAVALAGLIGFGVVASIRKDATFGSPVLARWREYAQTYGLELVPPGAFVESRSPLVQGVIDGIEVRLDLHDVRSGDRRVPITRLRATAPAPSDAALRVELRSPDLPEDASTMPTLDAEFDATFVVQVRGDDDARRRAARLLGDDVRAALLRVDRPGLRLDVDGGDIELSWRGAERSLATLDAASEALLAVARFRPGAAGYR